jgi:4-aminobutyrate aminotransferase-like enzyme
MTPGDLCQTFFSNSGAEANEVAIKLAQTYKGVPKMIGFWDSYHGSTYATASIGGTTRLRGLPGISIFEEFKHIPSPYCYRCAFGKEYPECDLQCARFLKYTIEKEQSVAAFMAEPICSWAGQVVPPKEYWPMVRQICDEKGVLLIFDEVMTGFARTGKMFACEHWNIVPDIESYAKGITSGYAPLGATIFNKRLADHFKEKGFLHSYTYSGHALACATALAVIDYYKKENLADRAAEMGNYMIGELRALMERHEVIGDIRALGLFIGVELVANRETKQSIVPKDLAKEQLGDPEYNPMVYLQEVSMDKGLAIGTSPGTGIIRMMPPLIITKEQVDDGLNILEDVITAIENKFNLPKEK